MERKEDGSRGARVLGQGVQHVQRPEGRKDRASV